jgi:putative transcriptional regulator
MKAKKTKTRTKSARKSTRMGRSIIRSLKEIRDWQQGKGHVDVVEIAAPIPPARVKAIRKKLAQSVRLFSAEYGLPAKTVQQWEQGVRSPDAASSLLLEVLDANPDVVAAAAKRRKRAA